MACLERNICFVYDLDNIIKVGCTSVTSCFNHTSTIHIMTQKETTPCHCWVWHTLTAPCRFLLQTISEEQEHYLHLGPEGGHFESCWIGGSHSGPTYSSERRQQGENQNTTPFHIPFCSYVLICLSVLCFILFKNHSPDNAMKTNDYIDNDYIDNVKLLFCCHLQPKGMMKAQQYNFESFGSD